MLAAVVLLAVGCASQQPVTGDSAAETAGGGPKQILKISVSEEPGAFVVRVLGSRQLTYTSVKQNLPLGVLFYFPETDLAASVPAEVELENKVIDRMEVSRISEEQNMTRLLIALNQDAPYRVTPDGTAIRIAFTQPLAEGEAAPETDEPPQPATPVPAASAPAVVDADTPTASNLKGVFAVKSAGHTRINVEADGAIRNFKPFTLEDPARIVIDIPNLRSPFDAPQTVKVDTDYVRSVRHFAHPGKVRVVVDTRDAYLQRYAAVPVPEGLWIQVGEKEITARAAPAPMPPKAPASGSAAAAAPVPAAAEAARAPADTGQPAWINRLDFRSQPQGASTIVVGTTRAVDYDLVRIEDKLLQLKLYNTKLPSYRNRPLVTTRFESAVNRITPVAKEADNGQTTVVIELRESVPYEVERKNDLILVNFEPSTVPPMPMEKADLPTWKQVMSKAETVDSPPSSAAAPSPAPAPPVPAGNVTQPAQPSSAAVATAPEPSATRQPAVEPTAAQMTADVPTPFIPEIPPAPLARSGSAVFSGGPYTGEKIALDFYETDIKNVFRILREISGKNFAIDKDVTGSVTLTLEKPVPWDQVLDLVLKMNRLGMAYEGDIIRIATLSTLTAEEKARQEQIKAERQSQQVVESLEPVVTEYIPVNYSDAKTEVLPHVQTVLSSERGSVSVDQRNNQLIVTDTAAKLEQIRQIVERIDTVTPQVIIEAKVVEVNDSFSMELGIDWSLTWGPISEAFGTAADLTTDISMNFPSAASSTVGFNFSKLLNGTPFLLDAQLNAVEAKRQGRIITSPKIVTLDNKKAQIKQGLEVPYLERDSSGNATVKFKNVDLSLDVTPTVTPDDRILMKIFITKNDIAQQTPDGPALSTNEAQTELLVNDGDTIVIGGIIKSSRQDSSTGWPGVKDVPLFGWLFKTESDSNTANELLIFITPRIVQLEQRRAI
jgi:type IV pilus assembly protein PilQ